MARKKQSDRQADGEGGQVNFRADGELWARLQRVCAGLGLDMANLARMITIENLGIYEERVDRLKARSGRPSED